MKAKVIKLYQQSFSYCDTKEVYSKEVFTDIPNETILAQLFELCNSDDKDRPKDLLHSMSVGDIVVIDNEVYVCQMLGWLKLV